MGKKTREYGGFWIRLLAYIIDIIIINAVGFVIGLFIGVWGGLFGFSSEALVPVSTGAGVIIYIVYFTYMYGSRSKTFGKKWLNLKVIDEEGNDLTYKKGLIRTLSYYLSMLIFGIGFLMVAFTKKKQGLHDKIAKTYVVKTEE